MSGLYLYAIVGAAPAGALGAGLAGEPLSLVTCGDVRAVVGEMTDAPAVTPETVRGHDAIVRRLAAVTPAILPARFGTVQEPAALHDWLAGAAPGLAEALRLVTGREQMTLHVFDGGEPAIAGDEAAGESADEAGLGPGARYLAERRRHRRERERLPELEALRPRLDALVAAERVELRSTPPLRASVYHLIERGRSAEYRDAVEAVTAGARVRVSGPWAPYAFAVAP